jgi:hypothetical protein
MRVLTCLLLVLLAAPAHATVPLFPCHSELKATEAAFAGFRNAYRAEDAANRKLVAAARRMEQADKAVSASVTALESAEAGCRTAAERYAACRQQNPKGGCVAQKQALQGATARRQKAQKDASRTFEAWTMAISDLAGAEAASRAAAEVTRAAYEEYERAAGALDKCQAGEFEKSPPESPPPSQPTRG